MRSAVTIDIEWRIVGVEYRLINSELTAKNNYLSEDLGARTETGDVFIVLMMKGIKRKNRSVCK